MIIGIISDSHDHVPHIRKAVDFFRIQGITEVLHAGDFCSPFTIPEFKGVTLTAVFGNNDGDHFRLLQKMQEIDGNHEAEFARLNIGGRQIALYHGTQPDITEALVKCGLYDLVISGHTHKAYIKKENDTIWVNPGSLHGFEDQPTMAVYDTEANEVRIVKV